jgi:hypothetical protein
VTRVDLGEASSDFAAEVTATLAGCLPGACAVGAERLGNRYVVRPPRGSEITLTVTQVPIGSLDVWFRCTVDSEGMYLAVEESQFTLRWGPVKEPLLRLHFARTPGARPSAHWHVHAERGAFSAILAVAGKVKAHSLGALHLPVGGGRMRPALEDLLEFLVRECGVDPVDGWESALEAGRERWRRHQIGTLVRDAPDEAVRVLEENGYVVALPATGPKPPKLSSLTRW